MRVLTTLRLKRGFQQGDKGFSLLSGTLSQTCSRSYRCRTVSICGRSSVNPCVDGLLTLLLTLQHAKSLGKSVFGNPVNPVQGGKHQLQLSVSLERASGTPCGTGWDGSWDGSVEQNFPVNQALGRVGRL